MSDDTNERIVRAVAKALHDEGIEFDAAITLVRCPGADSPSGFTIHGGSTGDSQVVGTMVYEQLRHMITGPVTVTPAGEPDPNAISGRKQ